jgi:hypothetical protein
VKTFATILCYFAYLFHLLLALFVAGLSLVALLSGFTDLHVGMLPFPAQSLPVWLLVFSLIGLISTLLAFRGKLRAVFLVYALVVFALLVYGYFLSHYIFSGPQEATRAAWITFGALVSFVGALMQFQRPRRTL